MSTWTCLIVQTFSRQGFRWNFSRDFVPVVDLIPLGFGSQLESLL